MTFYDRSNRDLLLAAKNYISPTYAQRINAKTKAAVTESLWNLMSDGPAWNEVLNFLYNQIGQQIAHDKLWENQFRQFKKKDLRFGSTIEEYMLNYAKSSAVGYEEDALEKEVFAAMDPTGKSAFHTINRQDRYKTSVKIPAYQQAFTQEDGLAKLVTATINTLLNGDNLDEFLIMTNLLKEAASNDAIYQVQTPALTGGNKTETDALLRNIRTYIGNLSVPSSLYNSVSMNIFADPSELIVFTDTATKADLDVTSLAAAFNMSYAEANARVYAIPKEHMPDGYDAIITTADFFQCADTYFEMTQMRNPADVTTNHWLHHHGVYSYSPFAPLIGFGRQASTVTAVDTTVKTLDVKFTDPDGNVVTQAESGAVVKVTVTADNPNGSYVTLLSGQHSGRTRLMFEDVLTIGADESSDQLTVTAQSGSVSKVANLKLVGEYVKTDTVSRKNRVGKHAD